MDTYFPPSDTVPHIKVCGLTRAADAQLALSLGASFLGIILTRRSPRHVSEAKALALVEEIRASAPEPPRIVGVFVDEPAEEIERLREELSLFAVQIHADPEPAAAHIPRIYIIPAVAIASEANSEGVAALASDYGAVLADAFSPDAHGGTGKVFEHRFVQPHFLIRRMFIAGGLSPSNIGEAVARLQPGGLPYAFDLSSGLEESPGIKSEAKMHAFFEAYRTALARV